MTNPSIYDIGQIPPLGVVPEWMHAAVIRPERYGEPRDAIRIERVPVPEPGPGQVLVMIMAAGISYNGIWSSLGRPLDVIAARRKRGGKEDFHVPGAEGSGVVWKLGPGVRSVSVGQEVHLSCSQWDEQAEDIRLGADPITSTSARVWGYEETWGSFAQFALVSDYQCFPKPPQLSWEESACIFGTGATAYRMLCGWPPHTVTPGDPVLIWGGSGGLGAKAIQITNVLGGRAVAVVSDDGKRDYCMKMGAVGVINRNEFAHWGPLPSADDSAAYNRWLKGARAFGAKFWEVLGEKRAPKIVIEHPGADTLPTSIFICDSAGMVTICGATTGFVGDVDLRYLWMRQKRLQGSHFANLQECAATNALVTSGRVSSCMSMAVPFAEIAAAQQLIRENKHPPGNIVALVNAPERGLRTLAP